MRGGGEWSSGVGADTHDHDTVTLPPRRREEDHVHEAFGSFEGPSRAVIREHIAQSFKRFDENDKGWLDRHDLKCAFASLTGYKPSKLELSHLTQKCPAGQVDHRHFAAYMEERLIGSIPPPAGGRRGRTGTEDARGGGGGDASTTSTSTSTSSPHSHSLFTSPHARMEHVRRVFKAFDVRRAGYLSMEDAVAAFAVAAPSVWDEGGRGGLV